VTQENPITVYDGKYTFFLSSEDGLLDCDRHGELWPAFRRTGSHLHGLTLALYQDMVKAQKTIRRLNWVRCNAKGCACSSIECDCREERVLGLIMCQACLDKGHGCYQTDRVSYR
jgi:hypothetical protein